MRKDYSQAGKELAQRVAQVTDPYLTVAGTFVPGVVVTTMCAGMAFSSPDVATQTFLSDHFLTASGVAGACAGIASDVCRRVAGRDKEFDPINMVFYGITNVASGFVTAMALTSSSGVALLDVGINQIPEKLGALSDMVTCTVLPAWKTLTSGEGVIQMPADVLPHVGAITMAGLSSPVRCAERQPCASSLHCKP